MGPPRGGPETCVKPPRTLQYAVSHVTAVIPGSSFCPPPGGWVQKTKYLRICTTTRVKAQLMAPTQQPERPQHTGLPAHQPPIENSILPCYGP